jgi:hypothetical protein
MLLASSWLLLELIPPAPGLYPNSSIEFHPRVGLPDESGKIGSRNSEQKKYEVNL